MPLTFKPLLKIAMSDSTNLLILFLERVLKSLQIVDRISSYIYYYVENQARAEFITIPFF